MSLRQSVKEAFVAEPKFLNGHYEELAKRLGTTAKTIKQEAYR
jgi:hypothetical protein